MNRLHRMTLGLATLLVVPVLLAATRRDEMNRLHRMTPGLATLLIVPALLAATSTFGYPPDPRADDPKATGATRIWKVTVPKNGDPWSIAYGAGTDFPQFAAMDPRSGYFRL